MSRDLFFDQGKKFLSRPGIVAEFAQHAAGGRHSVDFLHATHHHAHVTRKNWDYSKKKLPLITLQLE